MILTPSLYMQHFEAIIKRKENLDNRLLLLKNKSKKTSTQEKSKIKTKVVIALKIKIVNACIVMVKERNRFIVLLVSDKLMESVVHISDERYCRTGQLSDACREIRDPGGPYYSMFPFCKTVKVTYYNNICYKPNYSS